MRATASLALSTSLLLLACADTDKDPLDGVTAASMTGNSGMATGASASATGDPATTDGGSDSGGDPTTSTGDPPDTTGPGTSVTTITTDPTNPTSATSTSTTSTTGDPNDPYEQARQVCVDTINMYRATLGLPAYQRWTDAESCSDAEAASDGQTGTPHGAFGMCGEFAQNECPGWPSPPEQSLPGCLAQMWAEGPGEDFNQHGHYINMSSTDYTKVACGFADAGGGEMWMVQNFQ